MITRTLTDRKISLSYFMIGIFILLSLKSDLAQTQNNRPIGINLSHIAFWSSQWLFVDIMKQSAPWLGRDLSGQTWMIDTLSFPLRQDGYPTHMPYITGNDTFAIYTIMLMEQQYSYPAGPFTLIFEGTGEVELNWDVHRISFTTPNVGHQFYANPSLPGGIALSILYSDINDPVHNIRVILPGFENTYLSSPFHPRFLDLIKPFSVLRFMPAQATNYTVISDWSERIPPDYYSQGLWPQGGIAVEYIAQLCNISQKDAWVNLPHGADNNYIVQFATILRDSLDENLKVYIEYSNETWNTADDYLLTHNYTCGKGLELGLSSDSTIAGLKYTTLRSLQIFEIFDSIFGGDTSRYRKILSCQFGYTWPASQMLGAYIDSTINIHNTTADAFAVAPYVGVSIGDDIYDAGLSDFITIDAILDSLSAEVATILPVRINNFISLLAPYELKLITYEGGQHLVNYNHRYDTLWGNKLNDANRHERMREIYCDYYDTWYNIAGSLFITFNIISEYNTYTSFGIFEYMDQDTADSPKWMAHWDCVFDTTSSGIGDNYIFINDCIVYPNPVSETLSILNPYPGSRSIAIFDVLGRKIFQEMINNDPVTISTSCLSRGMYNIMVFGENMTPVQSGKFMIE